MYPALILLIHITTNSCSHNDWHGPYALCGHQWAASARCSLTKPALLLVPASFTWLKLYCVVLGSVCKMCTSLKFKILFTYFSHSWNWRGKTPQETNVLLHSVANVCVYKRGQVLIPRQRGRKEESCDSGNKKRPHVQILHILSFLCASKNIQHVHSRIEVHFNIG